MKDKSLPHDEELALLAQNGDRDAEELLLQKYKGKVKARASLFYMLGADDDDMVQEGMIGLFNAVRSFSAGGGASFSTFAELCINRRLMNAVAGANRKKHSPLNESVSLDKETDPGSGLRLADSLPAGADADPEAGYLFSESVDSVIAGARGLLSNMEQAVFRGLIAGDEKAEIAENLGISIKSVDNAIGRIRTKLKRVFGV